MQFLCCFSVKRNVRAAGFSKRNVRAAGFLKRNVRAAGFLKRNVRAAGFWRKSQNANFTPKFVQFRGDRIFKKLYTKKKKPTYQRIKKRESGFVVNAFDSEPNR